MFQQTILDVKQIPKQKCKNEAKEGKQNVHFKVKGCHKSYPLGEQ